MSGANIYQKDYPDFQMVQVSSSFAGGVRAAVITNKVNPGYYWWIPYIHGQMSDPTATGLELFLVDPSIYSNPFTAPGAINPPTQIGLLKLAPIDGTSNSASMTAFVTQSSRACTPFYHTAFLVPSNFALLLWEGFVAISASARSLTLRFAYLEIRNGCSPPIF
jgi:hypothetical protein